MAIRIGARPESSFLDPIGMLGDCHRRVERFLGDLAACAALLGKPLDPVAQARLQGALAYFRTAAPRHTADEEESLFPRLRQLPRTAEVAALVQQADALQAEHDAVAPAHAAIEALGTRWLRDGQLAPAAAVELQAQVAVLQRVYPAHIALEDTVLFPGARAVLPPGELEAIGRELAARRGVDFDAWRAAVAGLAG